MPLTAYQTPLSWVPDEDFINSNLGIHYLAWQIGRSENLALALWVILPVRESPEPLENLLPVGYLEIPLLDDVLRYGHLRAIQPGLSVAELEENFLTDVATVTQEVLDGYR